MPARGSLPTGGGAPRPGRRRRGAGLRRRLALAYLPLVLVATAALGAYLLVAARALYLDGAAGQLTGEARLVADAAAPAWGDPASLTALAGRLGRAGGIRVTLLAADGAVLGDSAAAPAAPAHEAASPEVGSALAGGVGQSVRPGIGGGDTLYVAVPVAVDGRTVGVARVAQPLDAIDARLDALGRAAVVAVAASGVLAAGLALLLGRDIAAPLEDLAGLAGALAAGHLGLRSHLDTDDEIGRLGRAFDQMAAELQRTIALGEDERRKLAAVLDTLDDGVLLLDAAGTVVRANAAAARLLGRGARDDLAGRPFAEVAGGELAALVAEAARTRRARALFVERDGARQVRAAVTPVRGVAERLVVLALHDLTELRRLETARRDFVANISHELRTPLASVKALVETLEGGAIEDDAVARQFLGQMGEEVDHLAGLVRELLELARIEAGQVALRRAAVAPADLILPTVARLRAQAERAGLTLATAGLAGLPPVLADPERIGQVLLNLLHNALKFTPPGGAVTVAAERRDAMLAVAVRDTGRGIDPRDLPRIFERFYKADRARSGGGTGLGLAIARHTVEAHGGALSAANNADGPGATFTFTLPLAPEDDAGASPDPSAALTSR
ncbi:MAG TPA: ATP-binding protein [Thermomicrobiales bacterium]|nr:ATP-binding protein [Thermomicrobiales bacterium]